MIPLIYIVWFSAPLVGVGVVEVEMGTVDAMLDETDNVDVKLEIDVELEIMIEEVSALGPTFNEN